MENGHGLTQAAWITSCALDFVADVTPAFEDVFGIPADHLRKEPSAWLTLVEEPGQTAVAELLQDREGARKSLRQLPEHQIRRPDGAVRTLRGYLVSLAGDGDDQRLMVIVEDLTEHRELHAACTSSEERYRLLFEHDISATLVIDPDTLRVVSANPAAAALYGYATEELQGSRLTHLAQDPEKAEYRLSELLEQVQTPGAGLHVLEQRTRDGAPLTTEVTFSRPIKTAEGGRNVIMSVRDISQRMAVLRHAQRAERRESLAKLAGGIAHEFNNQLTAITGFAEMMQMRTDDEKLLTSIRHILTAADRSAELTSKMLAFASESRSKHAPFDAHAELSDAVRLIQPTLSDTITVQLALDATSATVMGDAEQFRQAVVELMSNARDAMPDGGELCISSRNERVRQRNVLSDKQVIEPGDYILLTVTDTGCGIPFQARDHIFEPFFTTKDPASATGMGLSAVYGIVTGHGGGIDVSSSAEGTAVRLHLPLTDTAGDRQTEPTAAKAAPGSSHQAPQQRTKSVLLVDDEVYIRNAMELILRELGYRITTCASIAETLTQCKALADDIDLVILDVFMPDGDMSTTLEHLHKLVPDARILLFSGTYLVPSAEATAAKLEELGAHGFLKKPFRQEKLQQKIHELIGPAVE